MIMALIRNMNRSRREKLEAMVAETPNDAELRYFLAMEYVSLGDTEAGVRCFQELMTRSPDYVPTYVQAGQLYNRLDREAEARTTYQAGIAVAKKKGDFHAAGEMEAFLGCAVMGKPFITTTC
jgi:Tfp pilus assembly protein PilF